MAKRRDDLLVSPREKAIEAIKRGDKEAAIKYVEEIPLVYKAQHDRYGEWVNILLTFIGERLGEEAVKDANEIIISNIHDPWWLSLSTASYEDLLNLAVNVHKGHYAEFYIEEDDEKTTVVVTCCGSGGRLMKEGKFNNTDRHPMMGGTTKKAYDWSFKRSGFPYYCIHCCLFNELSEKYNVGLRVEYGQQYGSDGNPVDEPCKWIVYKSPGYKKG